MGGPHPAGPGLGQRTKLLKKGDFLFYQAGKSTDWAVGAAPLPGTLGESPFEYLGLYDLRPWEGIPVQPGGPQDWEQMQQVWDRLTLRVQIIPTLKTAGSNIYGASLQGDIDLYRRAALALVLTGWNNTQGLRVWGTTFAPTQEPKPPPVNPVPPPENPRLNYALGQAWQGPNILPSFAGANTMSIDVGRWARGCRFIGAWLWPFWLNEPQMPALPFSWETWDQPNEGGWNQNWPITWVQKVVNAATLVNPPTNASAVARFGPLPGASQYRLGVVNGGSIDVDYRWQRFIGAGAHADQTATASAGVTSNSVLPAFSFVGPGVPINYGTTHHAIFAGSNNVNVSGPLMISLTGGPYGF